VPEWVEIRIRDNGPGLEPRARREVFEPFFTTKSKGTGLGMAIAKRILDAHGGVIAVGDVGAPGAEFVLTLPRWNNEPIAAKGDGQ
jgi:signal transduction histidine kinase